jgi:DNA-binding NarL/FixJ family response regulator
MAESDPMNLPTSLIQLLGPSGDPPNNNNTLAGQAVLSSNIGLPSEALKPGTLSIGLIDCCLFSRECLITVLRSHHLNVIIVPFASVDDCIAKKQLDLDVVIYYIHAGDIPEAAIVGNIGKIRQAIPNVRIVVLSDVSHEHQPNAIRTMLNGGAHGFIPTRTTGILITIAAIRFVKAGGTFAPLDQLLTNQLDTGASPPEAARKSPLTSRQMAVLSYLQQGKANKNIAYELGMSESTVKVHIRNIMRKMSATNRTEAAFKAQQLPNRTEFIKMPEF